MLITILRESKNVMYLLHFVCYNLFSKSYYCERNMMMKFRTIFLTAMSVFSLIGCSNSSNHSEQTSTPEVISTPKGTESQVDYLGFVGANKIRCDVMNDNLGVTFTYGEADIVSKQDMDLDATSCLGMKGELEVEKINVVIAVETGTGFSTTVSKGLVSSYVSTFLSKKSFKDASKVYVAFSSGEVNWTKNLSALLDSQIQSKL